MIIMKNKTYQVLEYQHMTNNRNAIGCKALDKETFTHLKDFILGNNENMVDIFNIRIKKGIGEVITAKNYVGVIALKNGTQIEILPKISATNDICLTKKIFIEMIKYLKNFPSKYFQTAELEFVKNNLLEVFISMFLDEVNRLIKMGLKSNYELKNDNLAICKGKINFTEQIKKNYIHKEKFYLSYDEFTLNRVENRLIKSTLYLLLKVAKDKENKKNIVTLLSNFENIDRSLNYKKDLSSIIKDRNLKNYKLALKWCEIFLLGLSFTQFNGSNVAIALLFPMEKIFQDYVAAKLKIIFNSNKNFILSIQDKGYYLFENQRMFALRPDIVITNKQTGQKYIVDTKWKMLDINKSNYGIAQSDMYQMYAYGKKYLTNNVTLLFPEINGFLDSNSISFYSNGDVRVNVMAVNLFNINESLCKIIKQIMNN